MNEFVDKARQIAVLAHHGQYRRRRDGTPTNVPYIRHPERVAAHFEDDPMAQAVAWLHDTIEDTAKEAHPVTTALLRGQDIPVEVIQAVVAMTRKPNEDYFGGYLARVALNPLAKKVKVRDILDNLADDPTEAQIAKYVRALNILL